MTTHVICNFKIVSLQDITHEDVKLYLVFEYMEMDLKKYLDSLGPTTMVDPKLAKVSNETCYG